MTTMPLVSCLRAQAALLVQHPVTHIQQGEKIGKKSMMAVSEQIVLILATVEALRDDTPLIARSPATHGLSWAGNQGPERWPSLPRALIHLFRQENTGVFH